MRKLITAVFFTALASMHCPALSADEAGSSQIAEVRLISLSYFGAEIEVDFVMRDDVNRAYLSVLINEIRTSHRSHKLQAGLNTVNRYISRNLQRDEATTTETVKVSAYRPSEGTFFVEDYPFVIEWPGPQQGLESMISEMGVLEDFSGFGELHIDINLEKSDILAKGLLESGFPITKLHFFRSHDKTKNTLLFDPKLPIDVIRKSLVRMASVTEPPIYAEENEYMLYYEDKIFIGKFDTRSKKLEGLEFERIAQNLLSDEELYAAIGLEQKPETSKVQELYEEAYRLIDAQTWEDLAKAKLLLQELILIDPDFPRAYIELARVQIREDRDGGSQQAEQLLLKAKELAPDMADVRVLLGYVYTNQERFEEAEEEYRLAESFGTDNLWLYANWGLNGEKRGDTTAALDRYFQVLNKPRTLGRNDRPRMWVYGWSDIFRLLAKEGRYEEADKLLTRYTLEYQRNPCTHHRQAAMRLLHLKDPNGAISSFIKAKNNGCKTNYPLLEMANYKIWFDLTQANPKSSEANKALRKAEVFSSYDGKLFYALSESADMREMMRGLSDLRDINGPDEYGRSALLQAIGNGETSRVENLLMAGASPNSDDEQPFDSPIFQAVMGKHFKIVELLLEYGADNKFSHEELLFIQQILKENGMESLLDRFGNKKEA